MILYFEPKIQPDDWQRISEALKILHPGLKWRSGDELNTFRPSRNSVALNIDERKNELASNSGDFDYDDLEGFYTGQRLIDGWDYLGLNEDVLNLFDESIRKIIKQQLK